MSIQNHESHVLYKSKAEGAPPGILDRNGAVVLNMCRHCGKAESELIDPCEKAPQEMTQKMVNDRDFAGFDVIEIGWARTAETFPKGRYDENQFEMLRAVFYSGAMYAVSSPSVYALTHDDAREYSKRRTPREFDLLTAMFGRRS